MFLMMMVMMRKRFNLLDCAVIVLTEPLESKQSTKVKLGKLSPNVDDNDDDDGNDDDDDDDDNNDDDDRRWTA